MQILRLALVRSRFAHHQPLSHHCQCRVDPFRYGTIPCLGNNRQGPGRTGGVHLFVCTLKVVSQWFRAREFASMTGIFMAMGGLGSLLAAGPVAY